MQNTLDKKRDITVDLFRLIASILVVLIHTTPGQNVPILYFISVTVGRYAVPFFMIVTGYYYFLNPSKDRLRKIIVNIMSLWLIWMIIYLPHGINTFFSIHGFKERILRIIWSLFGETLCFSGSWYLTALAFGLIIVDYFRRKDKMWICNILAFVVLIIDCISTNYRNIFSSLGIISKMYWSTTIITGVLWITVAYFIAKNTIILKEKFGNIYFLIFAILLTMTEKIIIDYSQGGSIVFQTDDLLRTDMYITLPISIVLLFSFILRHSVYKSRSKVIFYRDLATLIYFVQFGILSVFDFSGIFRFINISLITLFTSILLLLLSKKINLLTKLYK